MVQTSNHDKNHQRPRDDHALPSSFSDGADGVNVAGPPVARGGVESGGNGDAWLGTSTTAPQGQRERLPVAERGVRGFAQCGQGKRIGESISASPGNSARQVLDKLLGKLLFRPGYNPISTPLHPRQPSQTTTFRLGFGPVCLYPGLENRRRGNSFGGSNPSPSACWARSYVESGIRENWQEMERCWVERWVDGPQVNSLIAPCSASSTLA